MDALSLAVLLPIVHPNLIAPFLSSIAIIFAVVLYKYANVMKSVFLYSPDETTSFAMHPIFKLRRIGIDVYDLMLKTTTIILALTPVFVIVTLFLVPLYHAVKLFIPYLVILFCVLNWKDWRSVLFFLTCGMLGLLLLDERTIIPIFTGLFGIPLIMSDFHEAYLVKKVKINAKAVLLGVVNSFLILFLPAIGPAQASVLTRKLLKEDEEKVVGIAAINAMEIPISLAMIASLGKARLGALNYVKFGFDGMLTISILVIFLALCFHAIFSLAKKLRRIKVLRVLAVLLAITVSAYLGLKSLLCLVIFSLVGLAANKFRINLSNGMGVLVFPYLVSI